MGKVVICLLQDNRIKNSKTQQEPIKGRGQEPQDKVVVDMPCYLLRLLVIDRKFSKCFSYNQVV